MLHDAPPSVALGGEPLVQPPWSKGWARAFIANKRRQRREERLKEKERRKEEERLYWQSVSNGSDEDSEEEPSWEEGPEPVLRVIHIT